MNEGQFDNEIANLIKIVQEKRDQRRIDDLAILNEYGIEFTIMWDNRVQLETKNYWIQYVPETGEWTDRRSKISDFGVNSLIKYVSSFNGN